LSVGEERFFFSFFVRDTQLRHANCELEMLVIYLVYTERKLSTV
jgi:hypothetical protein